METTRAVMSPLQPGLIAEALSFVPLNCFQKWIDSSDWIESLIPVFASAREGSHPLVLEIQSARNCPCKALLSPGGVWQLLLAACYSSVMFVCWWSVLTSEYRFWGKCSAGCGAQHRLAAWIHTVAFSLFGNWNIKFSIFEQFHVAHSLIPHRSVLPIACPYALFLISALKCPLSLFLLLTFRLLCPFLLFLTACLLLSLPV